MCGIFGAVGSKSGLLNDQALKTLHHRGPDDRGQWHEGDTWLGHVRLAIVDTSAAGHQPMISRDGRVVMVFNGEIYNFPALRAELERQGEVFHGHSDSEVLLALFAREGEKCFAYLNGIFAAAFWDRSSEILTLVRDPLGVKPLYLADDGQGSISFASEFKALTRSGLVKPRLDPQAVLAHLGYLWSPGSRTILQGVRKLLPGYALEFRHGRVLREWRYRDINFNPQNINVTQATQQVAKAVQTAVQQQMVADVPLGAFLSGGLDSSAVVAFAQQTLNNEGKNQRLQCFTIEVTDNSTEVEGFADDLPYARQVAQHLGVDLHTVQAGREMMDRLPEMVYQLDEPTPDPAALNTLLIAELARSQGIKVLLSGAGGDDIFTGYRRHFALTQERWWATWPASIRRCLAAGAGVLPVAGPLGRRIAKAFKYAGLDTDHRMVGYFLWSDPSQALNLLSPEFRAGLNQESLYAPMLQTLADMPADSEPLNRMLYLEAKHFLADHNLNYTDKMGMAAGIEVRVPLLDLDLVQLAGTLPVSFKQHGRIGKWIFKKAMEPYLPHDVIYRPKTGFGVPLRKWLHSIMRPLVDDVLSTPSLASRGIFDAKAVHQLLNADRAGKVDASYTLFGLVCMELWCRQYLDGDYVINKYSLN